MDGILEDLSSPRWWFTVVVVSFLVGLVVNAAPKVTSKVTTTRNARRQAKRMKTKRRIDAMVANPTLLALEVVIVAALSLAFLILSATAVLLLQELVPQLHLPIKGWIGAAVYYSISVGVGLLIGKIIGEWTAPTVRALRRYRKQCEETLPPSVESSI